MWMKYFIKLHFKCLQNFQDSWLLLSKEIFDVICQKIKCSYFKFISCLTLFQLGGITFTTVTVYYVTKPSWNRVNSNRLCILGIREDSSDKKPGLIDQFYAVVYL
jgi:hypothetical protein